MRFFNRRIVKRHLSPAERLGLTAFALAALLGAVDLRLATVPLTLFVILCAMAPFFPGAGFYFPVVSRGRTGKPVVALTFDDGPDPNTTPRLLDLLARYHVPATFFCHRPPGNPVPAADQDDHRPRSQRGQSHL